LLAVKPAKSLHFSESPTEENMPNSTSSSTSSESAGVAGNDALQSGYAGAKDMLLSINPVESLVDEKFIEAVGLENTLSKDDADELLDTVKILQEAAANSSCPDVTKYRIISPVLNLLCGMGHTFQGTQRLHNQETSKIERIKNELEVDQKEHAALDKSNSTCRWYVQLLVETIRFQSNIESILTKSKTELRQRAAPAGKLKRKRDEEVSVKEQRVQALQNGKHEIDQLAYAIIEEESNEVKTHVVVGSILEPSAKLEPLLKRRKRLQIELENARAELGATKAEARLNENVLHALYKVDSLFDKLKHLDTSKAEARRIEISHSYENGLIAAISDLEENFRELFEFGKKKCETFEERKQRLVKLFGSKIPLSEEKDLDILKTDNEDTQKKLLKVASEQNQLWAQALGCDKGAIITHDSAYVNTSPTHQLHFPVIVVEHLKNCMESLKSGLTANTQKRIHKNFDEIVQNCNVFLNIESELRETGHSEIEKRSTSDCIIS